MRTKIFLEQSAPAPMSVQELEALGIGQPDFVLISGDAYVDHPSFGAALIARVLQSRGYTVGVIAQPSWHSAEDFARLGRPKLAFLITSGNIDSMVNHYTAGKKRRNQDAYSPGGKAGFRPDRAAIVYANRAREAYRGVPVILGGIEASLRRFAHYDYWDNRVRNSILFDAGADILVYGMGESQILAIADALSGGLPVEQITYIPGTCYRAGSLERVYDSLLLPSSGSVASDKRAYAEAFMTQYRNQDPIRGKTLVQPHGNAYLVANPPAPPLSREQLDEIYNLPFTRKQHPSYREPIPALAEVEFSLASCRGCFGECSFCALTFHQGRIVQSRSHESLIKEAELFTKLPKFKGYIHDVGGPTANFRAPACKRQLEFGACPDKRCIGFTRCPNLEVSHAEYVQLLRKLRKVPGVKKVFVRSGVRYDYLMYDKDDTFLDELVEHHISGQLKVAPEHVDPRVLKLMGKPDCALYDKFVQKYERVNEKKGLDQYIVPYFISAHPGADLNSAVLLAQYLKRTGQRPEQVQDFYPTPGTISTCMYYTGFDPRTGEPVHVARSAEERSMQRALMQFYLPRFQEEARHALRRAGREDLIGFHKDALVPPRDIRGKARPSEEKGGSGGKSVPKAKGSSGAKGFGGKSAPRTKGVPGTQNDPGARARRKKPT
ncbi:MAG: YgiQ family radical SAM protein [Bacillota bacterium]